MRHIPEAGAVCGNSARTDLCGGAGGDLRPYRDRLIKLAYRSNSASQGLSRRTDTDSRVKVARKLTCSSVICQTYARRHKFVI